MNVPQGGTGDVAPAWADFVPTYSTDIGNAAASFTGGGAVTTSQFRVKKNGKQGRFAINFNALTLVVTPAWIRVSLPITPINWLPTNSSGITPAAIKIGAIWETGQVETDITGGLKFYRANRAVFPASTTFQCAWIGEIELSA